MKKDQKKILQISYRMHEKYANDFEGWVNQYISFAGLKNKGLTAQQKEISDCFLRDKNICVAAGGGIGKTALAALKVIWFLVTHPHAKVPTTAPSSKQLHDILWSEIGLWLKRCKLQHMFVQNKGRLHIKGFPEWYAVARTVPKDGKDLNDTLAGFHASHLMILVDEASGVPDQVYTALEGAMTDENSYIFLISNPVSTGGYFYDTISDPEGKGKDYRVLYFDSRDSPLVDESYEQRIITRYGKNSAMYKAKVLGQPISLAESAVVSPETYDNTVSQNISRFSGPVVLAIDVAAGGEDKTVFCHREGFSVVRWDEFITNDPDDITSHAISLYNRLWQGKPFSCIIDASGIGWGPYHTLKKKAPFPVYEFMGQEKARNDKMYRNRRTEGYHSLSNEFPNLHFPTSPPERLKKELANLRFDFNAEPIQMEDKKSFRRRLGFSPDYADALMMGIEVTNMTSLHCTKVPKSATKAMQKLRFAQRGDKFGKYAKFLT